MTWTPLITAKRQREALTAPPIAVSVSGYGKLGRYKRSLVITIRRALFEQPGAAAWLVPGVKLSVLLGEADDAGWVRLAPGKDIKLGTCGGTSGIPALRLIEFPTLPAAKPATWRAEYRCGDGCLDIRLPDWATAKPAQPMRPTAATSPLLTPRETGGYGKITSVADSRTGMRGQAPIPATGARA